MRLPSARDHLACRPAAWPVVRRRSTPRAERAAARARQTRAPVSAAPIAWPAGPLTVSERLRLVADRLAVRRRMMHAGEVIYRAGEPFTHLYVLNSGFFKIVSTSADGRNQVVALNFRGDWIGFDGIARGAYACDAVALDTGEVWALHYDAMLRACAQSPALLGALHSEMSRAILRGRESMLSRCTLPAAARVADFLRCWAESLAGPGGCTDQVTLRMSRAEIGNYLGMTLESVSRALSGLVRCQLIRFTEKGRRDIRIPDLGALTVFIQRELDSRPHRPSARAEEAPMRRPALPRKAAAPEIEVTRWPSAEPVAQP